MKTPLLISLGCSALLIGCGDSSNSSSTTGSESSGGSPLTAPVDYLNTAAKSEQKAVKVVDVTSLNQALQMFNVSEGRYPKDLNEMVEKGYMPRLPEAPHGMKIVYDAQAGTVKVVKE
jgi:hypothetical protein